MTSKSSSAPTKGEPAMTFEDALKEQFAENPDLQSQHSDVYRILNMEPGRRKRRRLRLMEDHVRGGLGIHGSGLIDWSKIDWSSLLQGILKIIMTILPLILKL